MPTGALTKRMIDLLSAPASGRAFYWDSRCPVALRITASGTKSFVVQYRSRLGGNERRHTLGRYGVLTVDEARNRAKTLLGEVADHLTNDAPRSTPSAAARGLTRYIRDAESSWGTARRTICR